MTTLYSTLFLPHVLYGVEVWFGVLQSNNDRIFKLQKKAIRAINCLPYNSPDIFSKCMILEYPNMWKSSLANLQAAAKKSGELLILWIKLQPNKSVKSEKYLNVLLLALLYRCVCLLAVEGPHFHCSQSNNAGPSVDSWMTLNYYLGMSYSIEFSNDFRWAPWSRSFLNSISDM